MSEKYNNLFEGIDLSNYTPKQIMDSKKVYDYIDKEWSSVSIAKKFLMLIENNFPDEWLYTSTDNEYILGYGISKEELRFVYRNIFNEYGIDAFCLQHNNNIQKKILDFINNV